METATEERPEVEQEHADGSLATFGRVWYQGKQVRKDTYLKATGQAIPEAEDAGAAESPDEVFQQLVQLAQAAGGMAKKKQERSAILDQVADLLNKLDPEAYGEILEHPAVAKLTDQIVQQKTGDRTVPPGTDLGPAIGKKPWTARDLSEDHMDWVVWTPRLSCPITYNGVTLYVQEDVEIRSPKCFKDIHDEARRITRMGKEHIDFIMRKRDSVSDPNILADGSRRVRGRFTGGDARVGKGLDIEVPDSDRPGIGEAGEGEGGEGGEE
ncbi:MAG TPA: hypothetical protein VN601_07410 [Arthrobacter sp.]|nr:hypothetical protein [Arthrobacter sp.]